MTHLSVPRCLALQIAPLTRRERDVLYGLAAGERVLDIATRLFISPSTAKVHVCGLYRKLGARTAAHAVSIAYQVGLLPATDAPSTRKENPTR